MKNWRLSTTNIWSRSLLEVTCRQHSDGMRPIVFAVDALYTNAALPRSSGSRVYHRWRCKLDKNPTYFLLITDSPGGLLPRDLYSRKLSSTDITATVAPIGVKFCMMVHISHRAVAPPPGSAPLYGAFVFYWPTCLKKIACFCVHFVIVIVIIIIMYLIAKHFSIKAEACVNVCLQTAAFFSFRKSWK